MNLRDAAESYAAAGWAVTPLEADSEGRPKKPYITGWQQTTVETIPYPEFDRSLGLGVVLGPASRNLAVIDIDDVEMAETVLALFDTREPYWVRTIRNRGHLYLYERKPSLPTFLSVQWRGREVKIELKAKGQQVAAPPTPGYVLERGIEPLTVDTIASAWAAIKTQLGITEQPRATNGAGYPRPWLEKVTEGERNRAIYVEAHRLREAGMPLASAIETLRARVSVAFQSGALIPDQELTRTIRSAYGRVKDATSWKALPEYANEV